MGNLQVAGSVLLFVAILALLPACGPEDPPLIEVWLSEQSPDWSSVAVTPVPQATPTSAQSAFRSVSLGGGDVCALRVDGSLYCRSFWLTSADGPFTSVSLGNDYICAVKEDGSLTCWGELFDSDGQATPPPGVFTLVSVGYWHACGVRPDGSLACWGDNEHGQATPPPGAFTSVSAGVSHTCGLRTDGSLACWGDNEHGQATPPPGAFTSVSAAERHTCGVRPDGSAACWGSDEGDPDSPPPGVFTSVSVGWNIACGVREDRTLACWRLSQYSSPGEPSVPPPGTFISVSMVGDSACAVREDGPATCWGRIPSPPSAILSITGRTSDSITVELVESEQFSFSETESPAGYSYQLHASRSPEGPYSLVASDIGAGTHVAGGLQPGAVYYLVLLACHEFGCSRVVAVAATESDGPVDAPATPTDFQGEKEERGGVPDDARLTWSAVSGATYYELWRGSDPVLPFEFLLQVSAPLEAQFFDTSPNRADFGEYSLTSWKVRACNKAGCSAFTNTVTIE